MHDMHDMHDKCLTYKEREQEQDLDMKTKMPKCMTCMTNASFYRSKFRTIDLMTNC